MKPRFSGKVAIVTGGVQGIGRAVVDLLTAEGAIVMVSDLDPAGSELPAAFAAKERTVAFVQGDMESEAFCSRIVEETVSKFGKVDCLVNNAYAFTAKALDAKLEHWRRAFDVGPIGFARMIQNVAPHMIAAGSGSIVNIASIVAHVAVKDRWTYCMGKGAVLQLTRCSALDLGRKGIRVNSVSPGWTWTREVEKAAQVDGGGRAKWEPIWGEFHMLGRCAEPSEIAAPVAFLLSEEASFITGTDLPVDAGYLAMGPEGMGNKTVTAGSN